jgi:hypothetical protein
MDIERVDFTDSEERSMFDGYVESAKSTFIQQSTKWATAIADIHRDEPAYFYIKDDGDFLGASLYFYEGEYGPILCSNVQAPTIGTFCRAIETEGKAEEMYQKLINHILTFAGDKGCITVSVMTNPFNEEHDLVYDTFDPQCGIESFIQTITIDKYFDDEGNITFKDYNRRTNLSRNVKNAYDYGFKSEVSTNIDDLDYWYENIHAVRINEVGGTPLPKNMFLDAFETMEDNILFLIAKKDGDIVGGDFCAYTEEGILENIMLSSDSDHFEEGVNFFLIDQLLRWCYENKISHYDWQSSNPPKGGVFRFKKQWGSVVRTFYHYTKILDEQRFEELSELDEESVFEAYPNHFIAPYHTLLNQEYTIETKENVHKLIEE